MNLLIETQDALRRHHKSPTDVVFVGSKGKRITWDEFVAQADFEFETRGFPCICRYLVVVGQDFWLERCERDGSKWWMFYTIPKFSDYTEASHLNLKED